ncbi:hypothetical protein GCM10007907_22570 [Chitinimonas prasina]|uniref:Uncharacterized protein n=1 Tax=Chitinimonas prasina TaxID=1434937 RepID=A0ABQ5YIH9_9NEIS|nr:hypothetical protein [Chitinimonas prasina]GLR13467.1 hypothetical protein GCM10007907_22570 [Chitinimonas prasina]
MKKSAIYLALGISLMVNAQNSVPEFPVGRIHRLAEASPEPAVLVVWDGRSKFASTLVRRGKHWYAAGGFVGGIAEFIGRDMDVHSGAVVYVHDSDDETEDDGTKDVAPFAHRKYVQSISFLISTTGSYRFYHCSKWDCPIPRAYRQRFDKQNNPIDYPDF